ncbi:LysR family transcriptional regulator [Mangrovactinospora gilvigrisea]|uniref:LysR family transcriptional regulator n=1 Tax=Mangrovactinospora gilvigrisea TaxID=1428644 RepID=A0A1J7BGV1_9ACTN|nr:LysR family transcriptional regulator [Mangrovactinospora gilvigrisea]OIV37797.1 LysR family transcriptional regulator [Mangrovactinospora gilvigrisea]
MLDLRRLRLLRELAHRGTIAAVAEALSFSPSAVSQQLSALEREAGVALLERTGRRVVLTPAGTGLARHAEALLERMERAEAELAAGAGRAGVPAGTVRLGAFPTVARGVVVGALAELARECPLLEVRVEEVDPAGVADAVRGGELNAALVHEYDLVAGVLWEAAGLARVDLLEEPVYLAEAGGGSGGDGGDGDGDGDDGGDGGPADAADPLTRHRESPWIMSRPGTLCHAMAVRACEAAGFAPRIRHRVDEYATVLELVAAGQGVALVPGLGAVGAPEGVRLTPLRMRRRIAVLHRRGAAEHPALAAVLAALARGAGRRTRAAP